MNIMAKSALKEGFPSVSTAIEETETEAIFKKPSPCAKKTLSIHEQLQKIREQLDPVDLSPLIARLEAIELQQTIIIKLLNQKLALDVQEEELMKLIKQKIEANK